MTRLTQIHMDTNISVFSFVFPNTEILVRQCDIEEDITTSKRAFSFSPHFSNPVLFFFTVHSNTFIYFLIKVDLCTSCDKSGIALSFFILSPFYHPTICSSHCQSVLFPSRSTPIFLYFLLYLFFLFFFYS